MRLLLQTRGREHLSNTVLTEKGSLGKNGRRLWLLLLVPVDWGEAADANDNPINHCFPTQTVTTLFQINHDEIGNDTVSREGLDNWKGAILV